MSLFRRSLDESAEAVPSTTGPSDPIDALRRERGERLPFRFVRSAPRGAESVFMIVAGLIGGVLFAAGPVWLLYRFFAVGDFDKLRVALFLISGFVALFCLKLAGRGIGQLVASRTPEPHVECDSEELRPGARVRLHLVQPGPARLEEWIVTLTGTRTIRKMVVTEWSARNDDGVIDDDLPRRNVNVPAWTSEIDSFITILREETLHLRRGERFEKEIVVDVPADARPTTKTKDFKFDWVIEVEGRPPLWANYVDRFPVIVRPA